MTMFKQLLVAIDGTPASNRALATALALGRDQGASVHVLHVVDDTAIVPMFDPVGYVPDYMDSMIESLREGGRRILEGARKLAAKSGQTVQQELLETRGQGVAPAILQHARTVRADLIVMGTHGRRGMSRLVMGSDAEAVLREATVPVLLVRSPEAKPARKLAKRAARPESGTRKRKPRIQVPPPIVQ
jgi:nucleotide-binding universal stress UspA family protein